ncbi:MAG TPA: ATP-grasp domain-containing protein [Bacillota bacterium]|nr:ATP-grasp domain-containing protein [Bacillota bacterium]
MNILLTSAGRRSYIVKYFQEALNGEGLVHAANSQYSPALEAADRYVITPLIYDKNYIQFLLDYSLSNNINAVTSLFDVDLPILAKAKSEFAKHNIHVIVSDYEVTQICNDKWSTYTFLTKYGFNFPRTYLSIDDFSCDVDQGVIEFPVIIKPRWGCGSIGIYVAENKQELQVLYNKVNNEILRTYLKYESFQDIKQAVIIQQMLVGKEYGLDIINDLNKNYITTLVKHKLAMRSGETDIAITEDNKVLRELGRKISANVGHIANLDVDCFMVDEVPYILEMNCRFGGGYPFSHIAGANLPLAIIKWIKSEKIPRELFEIKYNVKGVKDISPVILKNLLE